MTQTLQTPHSSVDLRCGRATAALRRDRGRNARRPAVETVRTIPVRTATVETRDLAETLALTGTLDPRAAGHRRAGDFRRASNGCSGTKATGWPAASCWPCWTMPTSGSRAIARRRSLDVAEANRAHARAEKDRADSLLKTGGITDKDHLSAQVAVQVAEASHAQARSELAIAERQLGRSQITAPISGRVAKRHADAGTIVNAGHADLHDRRRLGVRVPLLGRRRAISAS